MAETHGYSGKPLWQKLGMKPGMRVCVLHPPAHYFSLIDGAEKIELTSSGPAELVHLFCKTRADLDGEVEGALGEVASGGMLWVSWPKKSSDLFVDLTEGQLREVILPTGWVDVKVCAVDADWSGLKFLKRKAKA